MTPCERIGLKVGDKCEVINEMVGFKAGQVVTLFKDDGSAWPLFKGKNTLFNHADGCGGAYMDIENVRKVNGVSLTQQLSEAVAKRDKFKRKADKWAEEVERLKGELEREIEEATGCGCRIDVDERKTISIGTFTIDFEWADGAQEKLAAMCQRKEEIPAGVDPDDPATWKAGDVVECVCFNGCSWAPKYLTEGAEYKFCEYDPTEGFPFLVVDNDGDKLWTSANLRFVRRPSEG